ncbi:MAG: hypothetical protein ACLQVN_12395 [Bryobacteraceae bacterium]
MKKMLRTGLPLRGLLIAIAAVAPLAFPASQAGYGTLHHLAFSAVIPAALLLAAAWAFLTRFGFTELAAAIRQGATAGALATLALEAVRYSGFRMGFMPGNLPELMGVLLLDRFALGPTTASTLAGFAYHFWNGACFGMVFALGRFSLPDWSAIPYAFAIGVGFMVSPVVQALGVGLFGAEFGWHFAATVLAAHLAFGAALTSLLRRNLS